MGTNANIPRGKRICKIPRKIFFIQNKRRARGFKGCANDEEGLHGEKINCAEYKIIKIAWDINLNK